MKVLGLGNALVDVLVKLESETYLEKMNLPKGSMQLIDEDRLMKILDTIRDFDSVRATGGSASNAVCGIARLGIPAGFIGSIGQDFYGSFYKEDLQRNGVEPILHENDLTSGCAMTMITPDGERTFGTYLGAAADLKIENIKREVFLRYNYLFIEGYLVQSPEFILSTVKMAKSCGCKVVLDLASYNIVAANRALFKELLKNTDIVFANEEESFAFTGMEPKDACLELAKYCEIAVVKIGAKGSYIANKEEIVLARATKVPCVDTTGAGDLYAAGFLYGLAKGLPLITCGEIGALVSGQVIQIIGTKMNNRTWEQIKKSIATMTSKL